MSWGVSEDRLSRKVEGLRRVLGELSSATPVAQLDLSVRAVRCLRAHGFPTVRDLRAASDQDLLSLPDFGPVYLYELDYVLAAFGMERSEVLRSGAL